MRLSPSVAILRTQSDERLVTLARGGSQQAFQAIAERYRRTLHGACRRVLSESRAEDAVQQTFIAAWVALGRGDDVANLRSWLLMIARNTALNALRAPGYDYGELRESLVSAAAPQDELERREVMRQTLAGLAALPERQREALLRSAVEGVAYADIARDLGLSEGATRQLVLRARTTMRSAATALVPWPLAQWVAISGRADTTLRVAEIATATGGAGAAGLLAKASIVAVVAGGVASGPVVMRHEREAPPRTTATKHSAVAAAKGPALVPVAISRPIAATAAAATTAAATRAAARPRRAADHGLSHADESDEDRGGSSSRDDDASGGGAGGERGGESSTDRGDDHERDDDHRGATGPTSSGASDRPERSGGREEPDDDEGVASSGERTGSAGPGFAPESSDDEDGPQLAAMDE
jgi:RNA polymerase sigma factor (sigma-70 family)